MQAGSLDHSRQRLINIPYLYDAFGSPSVSQGVHGDPAATAVDGCRPGANLKTDGWHVYDVEREFARQGVIRPQCLDS